MPFHRLYGGVSLRFEAKNWQSKAEIISNQNIIY